jgi:hypothetical protein
MGAQFLSLMLASGGDRRISVPRGGNTNIYGASPFPRSTLGYAASTANDISLPAFRHLESTVAAWTPGALDASAYERALEGLRGRLRRCYALTDDVDVVFAPSGTDLEFVALSLARQRAGQPVTNVLLGQEEVGSGCALSASGRLFAAETALAQGLAKGNAVNGLADTVVVNVPVRALDGTPQASGQVMEPIRREIEAALSEGRHALVHIVHGSKTGLVLPHLADIDGVRDRFGEGVSLVVDACQARIEPVELGAYLDRGAIVLLTGSKFVGGPPFSGFALVPHALQPRGQLAEGLATLFRRAEWPLSWAGCDHLPKSANPGLLLRLEAALFELERFSRLARGRRELVIGVFQEEVGGLADRLGVHLVGPAGTSALHEATLATLDLSDLAGHPDIEVAQRWHRVLAARGLRLGQPVRYRRRADGRWAGTLRVSLSMPLIVELSALDRAALEARFNRDMAQIADVLEAAQRPIVA